jgi:hypothetical protein
MADRFALKISSILVGLLFGFSLTAEHPPLPPGVRCQDCHLDVPPSTTARRAGPRGLRFNHKLHLSFPNPGTLISTALQRASACQACHRRFDQPSVSHLPHMADCLVCHYKIDNPFSCEKCHTVAPAQLKPPSHTPDYVDTHSSGKLKLDKPSCVICHGREFTCLGCH